MIRKNVGTGDAQTEGWGWPAETAGRTLGVAKTETGPGPPVELADLRPKVVFNLGAEGSLNETSGNRRKCGPGKKTGHDNYAN